MEKLDIAFILMLCGIMALGWWLDSDVVINAPSNEASYTVGSACMVNMGSNRPLRHVQEDFQFCMQQHTKIYFEGDE